MVSHFRSPTPPTSLTTDESPRQVYDSITPRTWIGAIFLLPLAGMILGAVATGIATAILEVYGQVSQRSFDDLLGLVTNVILSMINVLAVAASATGAGALI